MYVFNIQYYVTVFTEEFLLEKSKKWYRNNTRPFKN